MMSRGEAVGPCNYTDVLESISQLSIVINSVRADPYPRVGDDESYSMEISAGNGPLLTAATVWGALRGLETFTQLLITDTTDTTPYLFIPASTVIISDAPRWTHRGLMIDTGRAFLPLNTIFAALDAMSYVKLNVLHWHISDDESFPMDSATFPRITKGAFQAPSRSHTYRYSDLSQY